MDIELDFDSLPTLASKAINAFTSLFASTLLRSDSLSFAIFRKDFKQMVTKIIIITQSLALSLLTTRWPHSDDDSSDSLLSQIKHISSGRMWRQIMCHYML